MRWNNNFNVNSNNHKLTQSNIKHLFVFTVIFSFNEIFYIILLYFSNDLYKISFILKIINFILIFCLLITNLYIIPYQNIRILLHSADFVNIEKGLTFASIIFSISIVIMSFFANFLYKFISINNPLCPYFNFCRLKKDDTNNYNYFCNYKPTKSSDFIDINTCQNIQKNITGFLNNCEFTYKCGIAGTYVEEEDTAALKIFTLILGIILFIFWFIIMIFWIRNFRNSNYKIFKKQERNPMILHIIALNSEYIHKGYGYGLCKHNGIEDNFIFSCNDVVICICGECKKMNDSDSLILDSRNQITN